MSCLHAPLNGGFGGSFRQLPFFPKLRRLTKSKCEVLTLFPQLQSQMYIQMASNEPMLELLDCIIGLPIDVSIADHVNFAAFAENQCE